jgi:hypothetical protein
MVLSCTDPSVFATATVEVASELSNATIPSAIAFDVSFAPSCGSVIERSAPLEDLNVTGSLVLAGIVAEFPLDASTVRD